MSVMKKRMNLQQVYGMPEKVVVLEKEISLLDV